MNDANLPGQNGHRTHVSPVYPDVSVIVVGYKSLAHLDRCFGALRRQDYPARIGLIFVDNQSPDRSAAHIRENFPDVLVVQSAENLGYAGGNNLGAKHASGHALVFLNPDTEVEPDWLVNLIRPMLDDPKIGLTTSKILMMSDHSKINTCGNEVSLAGITWCRGAGNPASSFDADSDVSAISGCAFAIRRSLFEQLGGFDERFFMYLEDTDLSWRARVAGYRCRFVANSIVYHDYQLHLTPWKIGLIEKNRYRMLGKHLSLRGIVGLAPALISAEILTWGYAALRGPRCVMAKARSTAWAVTQLGPVMRTRWRPIEGAILRDHAVAPPIVEGLGGNPSRLAQRAIRIVSHGAAALSLRLLPSADQNGHGHQAGNNGPAPADISDRHAPSVNGHGRTLVDLYSDREHTGIGLK
jgi:GT2 family glycosyltransferase